MDSVVVPSPCHRPPNLQGGRSRTEAPVYVVASCSGWRCTTHAPSAAPASHHTSTTLQSPGTGRWCRCRHRSRIRAPPAASEQGEEAVVSVHLSLILFLVWSLKIGKICCVCCCQRIGVVFNYYSPCKLSKKCDETMKECFDRECSISSDGMDQGMTPASTYSIDPSL